MAASETRTLGAGMALLEREQELAALRAAIARAADGAGACIAVQGGAGMGKSCLLELARGHAEELGVRVLVAHGSELERPFALGLVLQLLEPLVRDATDHERERLFAGRAGRIRTLLEGSEPGAVATAPLAHAVYWLLANASEQRPLAIVVDDAHWADPPSLRVLLHVLLRIHDLPVAILLATRPSPADPLLTELLDHRRAQVLTLEPLSDAAVKSLCRHLLDDPVDAFCAAAAHASGGNPFPLRELLCTVLAEGIRPDEDAAERLGAITPEAVARAVLVRLGRLSSEAGGLARAAAVLGDDALLRRATLLAGLDDEAAARALDELTGHELLHGGEPLDFVHPLIRTSVYEDTPPGRRGQAHLEAARLLRAEGEDPGRIAAHLLACPPTADAAAVETLRAAAARALTAGDPKAAMTLLERALAEPPTSTGEREAVLRELRTAGLAARAERPQRELSGEIDTLTPGELRTARLAAEGMTNREIAEALFVTVKAVEWHLGAVYRKLEIGGRRELRDIALPERSRSAQATRPERMQHADAGLRWRRFQRPAPR